MEKIHYLWTGRLNIVKLANVILPEEMCEFPGAYVQPRTWMSSSVAHLVLPFFCNSDKLILRFIKKSIN